MFEITKYKYDTETETELINLQNLGLSCSIESRLIKLKSLNELEKEGLKSYNFEPYKRDSAYIMDYNNILCRINYYQYYYILKKYFNFVSDKPTDYYKDENGDEERNYLSGSHEMLDRVSNHISDPISDYIRHFNFKVNEEFPIYNNYNRYKNFYICRQELKYMGNYNRSPNTNKTSTFYTNGLHYLLDKQIFIKQYFKGALHNDLKKKLPEEIYIKNFNKWILPIYEKQLEKYIKIKELSDLIIQYIPRP